MIYGMAADRILVIVEPGNIRRLIAGEPIVTQGLDNNLPIQLMLAYTPDIEWVGDEIKRAVEDDPDHSLAVDVVNRIIQDSLKRPAIDRGTM